MATRQHGKVKTNFKLCSEVNKNKIVAAFTTSKLANIAGYRGSITTVSSFKEVPEGAIACRPETGYTGNAWVVVKK